MSTHRFVFANLDPIKLGAVKPARGDVGVNRVADLLDTYARLKATGITRYGLIHHGTALPLYYRDPGRQPGTGQI